MLLALCAHGLAPPLLSQSAAEIGGCGGTQPTIKSATPANYQAMLATLVPGDLLQLAAGTYGNNLLINGLHGQPDDCIGIEGPANGPPAIIQPRNGSCCDTIEIRDSSYLVLRQLTVDSRGLSGIMGIHAKGTAPVHHLVIEDSRFLGQDGSQQTVAISSKTEAWNWVIRGNRIEGAGTGIYLGNSNGDDEFVRGLIEYNLITETIGYSLQIKHQNARDHGMPSLGTTIIRHNVLSKSAATSSFGSARPNLLVGQWPAGSTDTYLIYGNFLYENPTPEALFQGTGNLAFYDNLLVSDDGSAIWVQPHEGGAPQEVHVFQNTIVAAGEGIRISGADPSFEQEIIGNAVFAGAPLQGGVQTDNVTDAYAAAGTYLTNPDGLLSGGVDRLDLYPLAGALSGSVYGLSLTPAQQAAFVDHLRDFDGRARNQTFRGAYSGEGANPGWLLALERKPDVGATGIFSDGFESGDLAAWSAAVP